MAEFSMFPWETQTGTGDGQFSYNQDQANDFFRYFDTQDPSNEGVALSLNRLECTFNDSAVAPTIDVDTGAAVCYGRYWNDTTLTLSVAKPAVGTTGGVVFLQATWATNTIRVQVRLNTDGVAAIPALVQTSGTVWEIPLYEFTITTGGVFSETDVREYLTSVRIQKYSRTKTLFVPAYTGFNNTDGTDVVRNSDIPGLGLVVAKNSYAYGAFAVPFDFVSGMTVEAIVVADGASGNAYIESSCLYGSVGESYTIHSASNALSAVALTNNLYAQVKSISLASASIGDYVNLYFRRDATNVSDTIGSVLTIQGWLVTYTSDS